MQERAKITREKIFQTAVELFSAKGFHGTRIDEIARQAGVNKQRIYAHFGNKSELFEICLKRVFDEVSLFSKKSLSEAQDTPQQLTEIILEDFMAIHRKFPHFRRMLSWANLDSTVSVNLLKGIRVTEDEIIRKAFEKAREAGFVSPDISFETYIFVLMAISYFHTSNKRTLSQSLSAALYTPSGMQKLNSEIAALFRPKNI